MNESFLESYCDDEGDDDGPYDDKCSVYSNPFWRSHSNIKTMLEEGKCVPSFTFSLNDFSDSFDLFISNHFAGSQYHTATITLVSGSVFKKLKQYFTKPFIDIIINDGWVIVQSIGRVDDSLNDGSSAPVGGLLLLQRDSAKAAVQFSYGSYIGSMSAICYVQDASTLRLFNSTYKEQALSNLPLRGQLMMQQGEALTLIDSPVFGTDDLILPDTILEKIKLNTSGFFSHLEDFSRYGMRKKRGLLFHGLPGVGKTSAVKVLANELKGIVTFIIVNMVSSSSWCQQMFKFAANLSPTILVIEDIDFLSTRNNEKLCDFLNSLDGFEAHEGVVTIATTNDLKSLDDALARRPGRFDLSIEFPLPSEEQRVMALTRFFEKANLSDSDISYVVTKTSGLSYAHLQEVTNQIVMNSIMESGNPCYERRYFDIALSALPRSAQTKLGFRTDSRE